MYIFVRMACATCPICKRSFNRGSCPSCNIPLIVDEDYLEGDEIKVMPQTSGVHIEPMPEKKEGWDVAVKELALKLAAKRRGRVDEDTPSAGS